MNILEKYPTKLNQSELSEIDWVKYRTIELYDYLPQTSLEDREKYKDIRDEIIDLNYAFFGYIASHQFINNSSITYEDKFQSAVTHFCEDWAKFRFAKQYRTDLSFAVFFKPRVGERMERELNEVKYSVRRTLCMEVGAQLGKHWGQVTYDDLKDPRLKLPAEKIQSLQAMFGTLYPADFETHALFAESEDTYSSNAACFTDEYDTIEEMLMHEMILEESKLSDSQLLKLSTTLDIPFNELKSALPKAERMLFEHLSNTVDLQTSFRAEA